MATRILTHEAKYNQSETILPDTSLQSAILRVETLPGLGLCKFSKSMTFYHGASDKEMSTLSNLGHAHQPEIV